MRQKTFGVWISGLLIAALAVGVLAPAAEAKSKGSKRYKGSKYSSRHYEGWYGGYSPRRVVEVHHSSSAAPVIAGFIGGVVVGTLLARASDRGDQYYGNGYYDEGPAPRAYPDYDYVDPYCGGHYGSLSSYHEHVYAHRHPTIVRVIEVDTGRCAHVYRYDRGEWVDYDGDWGND